MRTKLTAAALAVAALALAGCSSTPSDPVEAAAVSAAQAYLNDGDKTGGDSACEDFVANSNADGLPVAKSIEVEDVSDSKAPEKYVVYLKATDESGGDFEVRVWLTTVDEEVCATGLSDEA